MDGEPNEPVFTEADLKPVRPKRKAWAKRERTQNGKPLPAPASAKEAKEMVKLLAADATTTVVEGKVASVNAKHIAKYEQMGAITRAHILEYLGNDIEAARAEFVNELWANCREVTQNIMGEYQGYKEQTKTFLMCALADKAQALGAKTAVSSGAAQVSIQVNQFGDGSIDREKLMAQLLGKFTPGDTAKPVEPVQP